MSSDAACLIGSSTSSVVDTPVGADPLPDVEIGSAASALLLRWLADLFASPPTATSVRSLRNGLAMLDANGSDQSSEFSSGVESMFRCLSMDMDDEALAVFLSIAYGRLFLGIGGPETVPLCESFYRCDGRLFQAPAAEMERLLAAHNYSAAVKEPADHVSIELALLAILMEAHHPDRIVLNKRLMSWVPLLRDLLVRRDPTGFWSGAAAILTSTIRLSAFRAGAFQST